MPTYGCKAWAIAGGRIPLHSTGDEPECTSHDLLCILNTTDQQAEISLTLYYADREPVGPYPIRVAARRVRQVRLNDLIDPLAIPLDTEYGCIVDSNVAVVIQFGRADTSRSANAIASLMAFPLTT